MPKNKQFKSRIAYSAAHVVCVPFADAEPLWGAQIDWEKTLAYRGYLWSLGLSVAEAIHTISRSFKAALTFIRQGNLFMWNQKENGLFRVGVTDSLRVKERNCRTRKRMSLL
ncbi:MULTISPECIES: DUF993 family protein [unclassified Paenibacillus]|uniref:DUF993 family protein n=1 Tax=unclassified Paenibacillus TaxID=185978 RepID=UPI0009313383